MSMRIIKAAFSQCDINESDRLRSDWCRLKTAIFACTRHSSLKSCWLFSSADALRNAQAMTGKISLQFFSTGKMHSLPSGRSRTLDVGQ